MSNLGLDSNSAKVLLELGGWKPGFIVRLIHHNAKTHDSIELHEEGVVVRVTTLGDIAETLLVVRFNSASDSDIYVLPKRIEVVGFDQKRVAPKNPRRP